MRPHLILTPLLWVIIQLLSPGKVFSQKSIYVNQKATGLNDGSSWTNAFTDLNTAIDSSKNSDTLKIAEGIYLPHSSLIKGEPAFEITDSRVLLGGYPATGAPTNAERNCSRYRTILSGAIPNSRYNDQTLILSLNQCDEQSHIDGLYLEGSCLFKRQHAFTG